MLILWQYDYVNTSMLVILVNNEYIRNNLKEMSFLTIYFRTAYLLCFVVMNTHVNSYFWTNLFPNHFRTFGESYIKT